MRGKFKEIPSGCQVAFNTLPDATWFDVVEQNGFAIKVREAGTDYAIQMQDVSLVRQIRIAPDDNSPPWE